MKLNLTNEKLTRLLLSANPVLANCKGSVKAVRLFMNMLGMKCILLRGNKLTIEVGYTQYNSMTPEGMMSTISSNMKNSTTPINKAQHLLEYTTDHDAGKYGYCTKLSTSNKEFLRVRLTEKAIDEYDHDKVLTIADIAPYIYNFATYSFTDNVIDYKLVGVTDDTKTADMTILVPNVTDKDLQPIKAVLTKQLQEILPINMIVTEDHIIGCANE